MSSSKGSAPSGFLPQLREDTFSLLIFCWWVFKLALPLVRVKVQLLYQKDPQETVAPKRLHLLSHIAAPLHIVPEHLGFLLIAP